MCPCSKTSWNTRHTSTDVRLLKRSTKVKRKMSIPGSWVSVAWSHFLLTYFVGGEYHCIVEILFYLLGFGCFAYVEFATDISLVQTRIIRCVKCSKINNYWLRFMCVLYRPTLLRFTQSVWTSLYLFCQIQTIQTGDHPYSDNFPLQSKWLFSAGVDVINKFQSSITIIGTLE